jgi:hypothetical protein
MSRKSLSAAVTFSMRASGSMLSIIAEEGYSYLIERRMQ